MLDLLDSYLLQSQMLLGLLWQYFILVCMNIVHILYNAVKLRYIAEKKT